MDEQTAWGRLLESAPRGRYEHPSVWAKRNTQRTNFTRRIQRTPEAHWLWIGRTTKRDGRLYPLHSYRELGSRQQRQVGAFRHLVSAFFPEMINVFPLRTSPKCGQDMCINPWHRGERVITRQTITADQAREIYAAKGIEPKGYLASKYGISPDQVLSIWRGRNWNDATGAPRHRPSKHIYTDDEVSLVLDLKGTASARAVARDLGIGYKFVLAVWSGERQMRGLSQEQGA